MNSLTPFKHLNGELNEFRKKTLNVQIVNIFIVFIYFRRQIRRQSISLPTKQLTVLDIPTVFRLG